MRDGDWQQLEEEDVARADGSMTSRRRLEVDIDEGNGGILSKTKIETKIETKISNETVRDQPRSSEESRVVYAHLDTSKSLETNKSNT